jgi:hypothetical protein
MHRFKKSKQHLTLQIDGPPTPTPLDFENARNKETTAKIEATNERLQASKTAPTPSLSESIEQQTRVNGRLRQQLLQEHQKQAPVLYFSERGSEILRQAIIKFQRLQAEMDTYQRGNR